MNIDVRASLAGALVLVAFAGSTMKGSDTNAAQLREFETFKETLTDATAVLTFLAAFLCFDSLVRDCLGIVMRSALRSRRAHVLTLLLPASLAFVNFV